MKKKRGFWADGFSISETKFSTLMVMTVVGFIYTLYSHAMTGEITGNLLDLVKYLVISVVGVNGVAAVSDVLQGKRDDVNDTAYNGGVEVDEEQESDPYREHN